MSVSVTCGNKIEFSFGTNYVGFVHSYIRMYMIFYFTVISFRIELADNPESEDQLTHGAEIKVHLFIMKNNICLCICVFIATAFSYAQRKIRNCWARTCLY